MTRNNTVLVISDRREQFAHAASRLRNDGYRVRFEKDPGESLKIARSESVRLVISELAAPDIDGLELCMNMRRKENFGSTPILLVGDLSKESSIVSDGLRCGANDYLQRPFDDGKLLDLCRDMTRFEDSQAERACTENIFEALIENISDAILIINAAGLVLFEGPSAKQALRNDSTELLGKNLFDLIHPADVAEVVEYFDSVHWGMMITAPVVYRIRENNVSWKLIESVVRPLDDARFGPALVVTSREKAGSSFTIDNAMGNDLLRRVIFDRSPVGLAVFSSSGHFVEGNPALFAKLNNSASELQNMSLSELIFPADDYTDRLAIAEIFSGKRSGHEFDNGYLSPAGERVWGRVNLVSISSADNGCDFLMGIFDEPAGQSKMLLAQKAPAAERSSAIKANTVLNFSDWKINKSLMSQN